MSHTINAPLVIADNIDGEAIILNMESGKYYSTQGSGAVIWQLLAGGCSEEQATAILSNHYSADQQLLSAAVAELKEFFLTENLLKPLGAGESASEVGVDLSTDGEFEHPEITSHTDMQGLLLLDPIHEVEDMGWPHKA